MHQRRYILPTSEGSIMEMDMSQLSEIHARVQYEVTISELHEYVLWKAILILKL